MTYSIEDAQRWASERTEELDRDRLGYEDSFVQMLNKVMPEKAKGLWDSGCWLGTVLREHGSTDEQADSICMAQGQRSFGGDQVAVDYANEFAASGDTEEKGGLELAEKRHKEIFGNRGRQEQ